MPHYTLAMKTAHACGAEGVLMWAHHPGAYHSTAPMHRCMTMPPSQAPQKPSPRGKENAGDADSMKPATDATSVPKQAQALPLADEQPQQDQQQCTQPQPPAEELAAEHVREDQPVAQEQQPTPAATAAAPAKVGLADVASIVKCRWGGCCQLPAPTKMCAPADSPHILQHLLTHPLHACPMCTCSLCCGAIATSLVLSCGHTACGDCLYRWLNEKPFCPTCQMGLRAVPVRCLALDAIVLLLKPFLSDPQRASFDRRQEAGHSAADKVTSRRGAATGGTWDGAFELLCKLDW